MEKMTKKDYFAKIKELLANETEIVAFCDHELELLAKKNASRGETKTQKENAILNEQILDILATLDEAKTVTELINETEIGNITFGKDNKAMSNQKLSRLLNDLAKANKVVRTETKGVAYFKAM
jgi:hypothetical protein